jgi:CxxC motif-containing protein (DUF1111 family)
MRMALVVGATLLSSAVVASAPVGAEPHARHAHPRHQTKPPPGAVDFTAPLPGLTPEQLARFAAGLEEFQTEEGIEDGLGPIFNDRTPSSPPAVSCATCHEVGGVGGGAPFFETRFGRQLDGGFDPLAGLGGTLQQVFAIPGFSPEVVPSAANVTALRRAIPLFGLGLVDAVPDSGFELVAAFERFFTPATAGRVSFATNRANQQPTVAKFGWKAQVPSLLEFAGNAYVNEMGITSPLFPVENCPNAPPGTCDDAIPNPEDDGTDVRKFTDFMTFLAPPPRGPITEPVLRGERTFRAIGCASCHLPTLVTGSNPVRALSLKVFHPYSDFLVHDMGSLGDGIGGDQADASGVEAVARRTEMRTQPLWGVRLSERLLHDGRATTLAEAIEAHDGQGAHARDLFLALPPREREDLLRFLSSL